MADFFSDNQEAKLFNFQPVRCSVRLRSRVVLICLLGIVLHGAAQSTTIHVPADEPTIQAGINAAVSGDTVIVAPGKYTENINFKGKNITLTSSGGAASTIIDGGLNGAVVTFASGENAQAVLNGFTIQNGGQMASAFSVIGPTPIGDGIRIVQYSTPTITNNIVTNNRGYGIEINNGGGVVQGNIINNTISDYPNPAGCDESYDGSGMVVAAISSVVIEGNTIENNTAQCSGGGIQAGITAVSGNINIQVVNNRILYNWSVGGAGGGIYMAGTGQISVTQNLIAGNVSGAYGGGVAIYGGNSATLTNNTIVGNVLTQNLSGPYNDGAQVGFGYTGTQTVMYNNLIISADSYNAIACDPLYTNSVTTLPTISNSDVYSYTGNEFGGGCTQQALSGSTVYTNNISANPNFTFAGSEAFHLSTGSPAAATGNPNAPGLPSTDLDGAARTESGIHGALVDMGIYEGAVTAQSEGTPTFTMHSTPSAIVATEVYTNTTVGTTTVTITPTNGLFGTISLSCPNVPSAYKLSCSFSPNKLGAAGDNVPISSTLSLLFYGSSMLDKHDKFRRENLDAVGMMAAAFLLFYPLGLRWTGRKQIERLQSLAMLRTLPFLIAVAVIAMAGCGSGTSTSSGTSVIGSQNPSGPIYFPLTIQATSAGNFAITQTEVVTFTIAN